MASQGIHESDKYDSQEHLTSEDDSYENDDSSDEYDSDEYDTDTESMAPGSTKTVEDVTASLTRHEVKSVFDKTEFLPSGSLDGIITVQRVHGRLRVKQDRSSMETQESRQADQATVDRLANYILTRSKKVFAIMLYANLSNKHIREAITQFQNRDVDDGHLPLFGDAAIFISSTTKRHRRPWNHLRAKTFCLNQWRFLAPIFDSNRRELTLHPNHILPFTWAARRGGGMFGEVHEVTIHPAHGKNVVNNSNVAVKKLQSAYTEDHDKMRELEDAWQQEVQAHIKIVTCRHSNIIRFITAVTRDSERYLLFEWANGGNLREFWHNHSPRLTRTLVKDVMLQLRGLADALEKIHSMGFRHGDMKPENILRVKTRGRDPSQVDVGTLKICDMGLTKYHKLATQLRELATNTKFTTWRYEPPEATEENKAWSRRYDTWSIGCIVLEYIVWMVYGIKELKQFNDRIVNELGKQGRYFQPETNNGRTSFRIHAAVVATMDSLSRHPECIAGKTALGDLLQVVKKRLLVVALGPPNGKGNTQQLSANTQFQSRADSETLKNDLDGIILRGIQNGSYWLKGESSDDAPSLCTPPAVRPSQGLLTVDRRHSSGVVQGQLTIDSSSHVVPILTGVVGVGGAPTP